MSWKTLLNPLNAVKLLNPVSTIKEVIGGIKTVGAAIGIANPASLKPNELKTAKQINTLIKDVATPITEAASAAAPWAGAAGGAIAGGLPGAFAGLAAGTAAGGLGYGATTYPTATEKTFELFGKGASMYADQFKKNPIETSLLTAGGALALGAALPFVGRGLAGYFGAKQGANAAINDIPLPTNNLPSTNSTYTTTNPNTVSYPAYTTETQVPPVETNNAITTTRKGARSRRVTQPKDIKIRNTVNVYNAIKGV